MSSLTWERGVNAAVCLGVLFDFKEKHKEPIERQLKRKFPLSPPFHPNC